jgi:nucleotide-binding universal stress UspA family protein
VAGIRSVLVGLDGSAHSLVALRWAGWCAAATGADLHVAHAWQQGPPLDGALGAGIADAADLEAAVERRLRQLAAAELRDPGAVAGARALRGEVPTALTREAARLDAGLVVVGARGAGNALRALLGSTASRLTECPVRAVAVVPDDAEVPPRSGAGLLVGVDGSTGASRAVRWAAAVARAARRPVVAVHAFEPGVPDLTPEEGESLLGEARLRLDEEWVAPLRARGVEHRTVVEPGDPPRRPAPGGGRRAAGRRGRGVAGPRPDLPAPARQRHPPPAAHAGLADRRHPGAAGLRRLVALTRPVRAGRSRRRRGSRRRRRAAGRRRARGGGRGSRRGRWRRGRGP